MEVEHKATRVGNKPDWKNRKVRFANNHPENEGLYNFLRKEAPEDIIEPDLPIIDPHHHFFDMRGRAPMTQTSSNDGQVVYQLPEILEDTYDGHNVVKTVYTQAFTYHLGRDEYVPGMPNVMRPIGEVEYCQGVAAQCDSAAYGDCRVCAGITGTADLFDPNVEKLIKACCGFRNYRGIRSGSTGPTGGVIDPENQDYLRGLAVMEKYDLTYDVFQQDPTIIPNITKVAKKFPKLRIVLNHCGGEVGPHGGRGWRNGPAVVPGSASWELWKKDMKEIADSCPNVVVKTGGIQMPSHGHGFDKRSTPIGSQELCDVMLPYYREVINAFGPKRCMFESNFPMDKSSCSYRVLWNMFKRVANAMNLSAEDKKWIFHDCAATAYKLNDTTYYSRL